MSALGGHGYLGQVSVSLRGEGTSLSPHAWHLPPRLCVNRLGCKPPGEAKHLLNRHTLLPCSCPLLDDSKSTHPLVNILKPKE